MSSLLKTDFVSKSLTPALSGMEIWIIEIKLLYAIRKAILNAYIFENFQGVISKDASYLCFKEELKMVFRNYPIPLIPNPFRQRGRKNSPNVSLYSIFLSSIDLLPLWFRRAGRVFVVAHGTLSEPRVTMDWLLAKPRSSSNFPAFLVINGKVYKNRFK